MLDASPLGFINLHVVGRLRRIKFSLDVTDLVAGIFSLFCKPSCDWTPPAYVFSLDVSDLRRVLRIVASHSN